MQEVSASITLTPLDMSTVSRSNFLANLIYFIYIMNISFGVRNDINNADQLIPHVINSCRLKPLKIDFVVDMLDS